MVSFADDVKRKVVIKAPMNEMTKKMNEVLEKVNNELTEEIQREGYAQNVSKQMVVPRFKGPGMQQEMRKVLAQKKTKDGADIVSVARHLGPYLHVYNQTSIEKDLRLKAAKEGWREMGTLWSSPDVPWGVKRMTFISKVQGALFSGAETMLWTAGDLRSFDKLVLKYIRVMMSGDATERTTIVDTSGNESIVYRRLPEIALWKWLQIVPAEEELRVRRLRWAQGWAKDPENNAQVLAAYFGQMREEKQPSMLDDGTLLDTANRWALRFQEDMEKLTDIEDGDYLMKNIQGKVGRIFIDEGAREDFINIDMKQMRRKYLSMQVAPGAEYKDSVPTSSDDDEEKPFVCGWEYDDDENFLERTCNAAFSSKASLLKHRRRTHGQRLILHSIVVTNQCPVCNSSFSTRATAQKHLVAAYRRGFCILDKSIYNEIKVPRDLECPAEDCDFDTDELQWLQQHIRDTHCPKPLPDFELVFYDGIVHSDDEQDVRRGREGNVATQAANGGRSRRGVGLDRETARIRAQTIAGSWSNQASYFTEQRRTRGKGQGKGQKGRQEGQQEEGEEPVSKGPGRGLRRGASCPHSRGTARGDDQSTAISHQSGARTQRDRVLRLPSARGLGHHTDDATGGGGLLGSLQGGRKGPSARLAAYSHLRRPPRCDHSGQAVETPTRPSRTDDEAPRDVQRNDSSGAASSRPLLQGGEGVRQQDQEADSSNRRHGQGEAPQRNRHMSAPQRSDSQGRQSTARISREIPGKCTREV